MGESKHTPGPWVISHSSDKRTGTCIRTAEPVMEGARDGMAVCRMVSAPGATETRANAALIAAAPLMLEALREGDGDTFAGTLEGLANLLVVLGGHPSGYAREIDWLRNKAGAVRAAIKAATGGEP